VPFRPRLRGLLHTCAFVASVPAAAALLLAARTGRATLAASIYGLSLVAQFGVGALFHRVTWSLRARRWMGRLDHATINGLIAGTYTPIALMLSSPLATVSLVVIWVGAIVGVLIHVLWIDETPKWLSAALYVVLGWAGMAAAPEFVSRVGWTPTVLLALGGALYSAGAAVYALRRPDPAPAVFGYHEVFHALVITAAFAHYAAVAFWVLPQT
jgi:hemolysin III